MFFFFIFRFFSFGLCTNDAHEAQFGDVNTVAGARGLRWGHSNVNIVLIRNTVGRFDESIDNGFE